MNPETPKSIPETPWDIYRTNLSDVTVLEGNWAFNTHMRVLLNGNTRLNDRPLERPVEVAGIIRATRLNDAMQSVFLKAPDGQRSADIFMDLDLPQG